MILPIIDIVLSNWKLSKSVEEKSEENGFEKTEETRLPFSSENHFWNSDWSSEWIIKTIWEE